MITIPVVLDPKTGHLVPTQPIPKDAIAVVCDGKNFVVYEQGDTPPA